MRSSIFAIALIMAIGLLATVHLGTNDVAAKGFVKKSARYSYTKKKQFNFRLCTELGQTSGSCGKALQKWLTKHPNGKVTY
jgi:hypothetical protein